jgi:hypothetical protein
MNLDVSNLKSTLESWGNVQVLISKVEMGDVDRTVINLNDLSLESTSRDTDDYLSDQTLQIVGKGYQVMEDTKVSIPYETYDIPVEAVIDYQNDGDRIHLVTNRASYTITRM